MKKIFKIYFLILLVSVTTFNIDAHERHKHIDYHDTIAKALHTNTIHASQLGVNNTDGTKRFVTYHPLVIHFPIVLLIISAIFQTVGIFSKKQKWDYITLFLIFGGVIGAYLSSSFFHPHTEGLTPQANLILEKHEFYASLTFYSSVGALLLKMVGIFICHNRMRLIEIITAIVLLFSALSVSLAGHWGAYLTHIEGVGPQGKFLEMN